jgi:hypothetical protein
MKECSCENCNLEVFAHYIPEVKSPLFRIFVVHFTTFINPNSTKKPYQKARI